MTKSRTLPHSLYRQLKDEIKRRERRVLELEAALQRTTATHTAHSKQLQAELDTVTESLAAAEAQIASLLEEHAMRDAAYTTLAVIGAVAACTAVISALHYLPKVLC